MSSSKKNTLLFRLYQVLYDHSDAEHPLTQQEIISLLESKYGIEVERKSIPRNVKVLQDMGYDVVPPPEGTYLDEKIFNKSELRFLIDSVLCNRHINAAHSKDLIDKLISLGGQYFKPLVKHTYAVSDWPKSNNHQFFYNIELVDEAIENNKQLSLQYNRIGIDNKLHKTASHVVSPYQMILHNQHYFLMCRSEHWKDFFFLRMDKITDMEILSESLTPIRSIKGYENGINYKELTAFRPYMFSDEPENIKFKCPESFYDSVSDWFNKDIYVERIENDFITISLVASPLAMAYWALQFGEFVEILEPSTIRDKIKKILNIMNEKYK